MPKTEKTKTVDADSRQPCYSPDQIPVVTRGAISRTRVFAEMKAGRLKAKRAGRRTLITDEELRRYISALPDREQRKAEQQ
jgi:hypothetical protein